MPRLEPQKRDSGLNASKKHGARIGGRRHQRKSPIDKVVSPARRTNVRAHKPAKTKSLWPEEQEALEKIVTGEAKMEEVSGEELVGEIRSLIGERTNSTAD